MTAPYAAFRGERLRSSATRYRLVSLVRLWATLSAHRHRDEPLGLHAAEIRDLTSRSVLAVRIRRRTADVVGLHRNTDRPAASQRQLFVATMRHGPAIELKDHAVKSIQLVISF